MTLTRPFDAQVRGCDGRRLTTYLDNRIERAVDSGLKQFLCIGPAAVRASESNLKTIGHP